MRYAGPELAEFDLEKGGVTSAEPSGSNPLLTEPASLPAWGEGAILDLRLG